MRDAYTITVTDPQGHQTVNYYSGDGELYRSEGATYPVAYAKNAAGQMAQLHTWRNEAGNSDITRWYYDPFTGAVTNKLYADGKGTAYTYLADGRIASRLWARGVTTAYGYIDTATGSIRTTEYNDETQSITNTFSLAGQLLSVLDGTGATTFGYDSKGRQTAETNALAIITRSYDTYGRYIRFTLTPWLSSYPSLCINYGYDLFNRIDTITAIIGTETHTFTYSYIPGTTLISGYTALTSSTPSPILTVSKTYEMNRNLITAITNSVGTVPSVVSSFTYSNDTTGKRTARSDYYDGSAITNTFDFNARGEVTNVTMNANAYNYNFDDIGNRTTSSMNSVFTAYTVNQLNQYTSVSTVPSVVNPIHDADGSLTFDGTEWHHGYNGENRLITSSNEVTGVYITYAYDYQNRRISMTTLSPDPFSSLTSKYIWDGWNIGAEIIIDEVAAATNITYYTWGLDLSGTLQGAGGVGGLLCETKTSASATNTYYALSDANGNVTEYIDKTGAVKAHIEYSATGEETYKSGTMKDDFTHRFSTKPYDPVTRLVQYQQRPYDSVFSRWLSRDPIGERGGKNLYLLGNNDVINKWDYLGKTSSVIEMLTELRSAAIRPDAEPEEFITINVRLADVLHDNCHINFLQVFYLNGVFETGQERIKKKFGPFKDESSRGTTFYYTPEEARSYSSDGGLIWSFYDRPSPAMVTLEKEIDESQQTGVVSAGDLYHFAFPDMEAYVAIYKRCLCKGKNKSTYYENTFLDSRKWIFKKERKFEFENTSSWSRQEFINAFKIAVEPPKG